MARLTPKFDVVRALFARSGNRCAFPGCEQPLINHKNQFIGQLCHIEGALPGGERYNPDQDDEKRRDYSNLLLLCYPHHVETNNVDEFPMDLMRQFKRNHEALFEKGEFRIDELALRKIVADMDQYWAEIEKLNTLEHAMADLAFSIDAHGDYFGLMKSCGENVAQLSTYHDAFRDADEALQHDFGDMLQQKGIDPRIFDDVPYYENPFLNRNWESHSLGVPNCMQRLHIDLMHLEIKYIEEFLKTNSTDEAALGRLQELKKQFAELAQFATMYD